MGERGIRATARITCFIDMDGDDLPNMASLRGVIDHELNRRRDDLLLWDINVLEVEDVAWEDPEAVG